MVDFQSLQNRFSWLAFLNLYSFSQNRTYISYIPSKKITAGFFFRTFRSLKRPAFFFNWLLNYQGCVWFAFHRIFWDASVNPPVGWLNDANKTPEVCALDQFAVPSAAAIFPEALEGVGVPQLDRSSRSWTMGVPWGGYGRGGWSVSFFFKGTSFIAVNLWGNVLYYNRGQGMIKDHDETSKWISFAARFFFDSYQVRKVPGMERGRKHALTSCKSQPSTFKDSIEIQSTNHLLRLHQLMRKKMVPGNINNPTWGMFYFLFLPCK